jgi:hypothetical protein
MPDLPGSFQPAHTGRLSLLFSSLVPIYASYQTMTGTDKDNSQIDFWLLIRLSCVNRLDFVLYIVNTGEWIEKAAYFAGDR